jgi:hypothetical protein
MYNETNPNNQAERRCGMNGVNDGGPAYPYVQMSEATGQPINGCFSPGMTLRDWFAGQALAMTAPQGSYNTANIAEWCYSMADAMLAERGKGGGK